MKRIVIVLMTFGAVLILDSNCYSQDNYKSQQDLVLNFLNYVKEPNWKFDTLADKYVLFRKDESPKYTRDERKLIVSFAVSYLSTELKNVELRDIIITPYLEADSSMQRMFIKPDTKKNVIIAYTKNRQFIRYFWIVDNKIKSFVTFKQGKVFVLLN